MVPLRVTDGAAEPRPASAETESAKLLSWIRPLDESYPIGRSRAGNRLGSLTSVIVPRLRYCNDWRHPSPADCVHTVASGVTTRLVNAPDGVDPAPSVNSPVVRSVGPALMFMLADKVPPWSDFELPHGSASLWGRSSAETGVSNGHGRADVDASTVLVVPAVSPDPAETEIELLFPVALRLDADCAPEVAVW